MSINAQRQIAYGSQVIALNTVVAGTVTRSPTFLIPGDNQQRAGLDSLYMQCAVVAKVSTIVLSTGWQGSNDGTNWYTIYTHAGNGFAAIAAAGNGSSVTTTYFQMFQGDPAAFRYIVGAVLVTVATGGTSDQVTMSYGWSRRQQVASL
jgi:hypothetical protein